MVRPSARWLPIAMLATLLVSACTTTTRAPSGIEDPKPVVSDPLSRARVHTELAALYYQQGSMKTALDELRSAVKIDPAYAPAYSMYGLVYMQLGETAQAQSSFQKAISLAPSDPDIRNNYGLFLCDNGQYQAGLGELEKAWSNPLYETPGRALLNASGCADRLGESALAQSYAQRAARYGVTNTSVAPSRRNLQSQ